MLTPVNIPWRAVGAGVLAAALLAGGWVVNGWRLGAQIEEMRADREKAAKSAAFDQVKAVDDARLEEQRRTAAQTEISNEAIQQAESARADARVADSMARELRARATALANASRGAGNSTAVGGGTPAAAATDLLADLFGRADARAGELAAALDASSGAGRACERSYNALDAAAVKGR